MAMKCDVQAMTQRCRHESMRSVLSIRFRFSDSLLYDLAEVGACIDLMCAFRLIPPDRALAFKSQLEAISKTLWALMR